MAFKPLAIKNIERTKPVDSNLELLCANIIDNVLNCIKDLAAHPLQQISKIWKSSMGVYRN
jgi:hypothetical protein